MLLIGHIAATSTFLLVALLFVLYFLVFEGGFRAGRRFGKQDPVQPQSAAIVIGGMLTLFAFVLALSLSTAMNRVGERRQAILSEGRAISTATLQARAVADPRAAEISRLLEEYRGVRRDFVAAPPDVAVLDGLNSRTLAIQAAIWGHLTAIAQESPGPIVNTLMASLSTTFEAATAVRFALDFPLPPALRQLLAAVALLTMGALGFMLGLRERRMAGLVALFILMACTVLLYIFDAAAARIGQARPPTSVYEWSIPPASQPPGR
jgi:hypothetical protein